jgi:hypothetical protein
MNKKTINRAIAHLGIEIQNNRDGYSYFTSLETGDQIGHSVMVCYLNSYTLDEWVSEANWAKANPDPMSY